MRAPNGLNDRELAQWLLAHRTHLSESCCLIWTGSKDRNGYGQIFRRMRTLIAHRFIKASIFGSPADDSMHAAHSCHTASCVNPDHISWQTARENVLDSSSVTAQEAKLTCCPKCGGEYTLRSYGGRICKKCRRDYHRAYYHERKSCRLE